MVFLVLEADLGVAPAGVALVNLVRSGAFTSFGSYHAYSPPTTRSKHNALAMLRTIVPFSQISVLSFAFYFAKQGKSERVGESRVCVATAAGVAAAGDPTVLD